MQCPYCDENSILTEDALDRHIVTTHPEHSDVGVLQFEKKLVLWSYAMGLTGICVGKSGASKEMVLDNFKYFLRELMKSDG